MAEHIDLGDELGAWEDPVDSPPAAPPPLDRGQSRGRGRWMPLADLQAQGFNTTPPPGFAAGGRIMPPPTAAAARAALRRLEDRMAALAADWPLPDLPEDWQLPVIDFRAWLPGDDGPQQIPRY